MTEQTGVDQDEATATGTHTNDGDGPANTEGTTAVELPDTLVERVEDRLERTDFETTDDYVTFVLEETLARVEAATDEPEPDVDETEIRSRLESLGYLDS